MLDINGDIWKWLKYWFKRNITPGLYALNNMASKYIKPKKKKKRKKEEGKKKKKMNWLISIKEIVFKIKTLSTKKTPDTYGFTGKLFLTFKEINTTINNIFHTTVEEWTLPNLIYVARITLIINLDKDIIRKEKL